MSRTMKILLGIIAGLLVLCLCATTVAVGTLGAAGYAIARIVVTEPGAIGSVADGIATYRLPAGWQEQYAASLLGYSMVEIQPAHPRGHVFLVQLPPGSVIDPATIRQQAEETSRQVRPDGHQDWRQPMQVVGQQQVTIRGQAVTLRISEATNSDGQPYRQADGLFQGRGGQALISIEAPIQSWNDAAIQDFLSSIE